MSQKILKLSELLGIQPKPKLQNHITTQQISLFDTFGFIKIEGFLKDEVELISNEFDRLMNDRYGQLDPSKPYLYPQFADNSELLTGLLGNEKICKAAQQLCGDDYIYRGSDGSIFREGSPWHRDCLMRVKSVKMLVYLEKNTFKSGPFCAIPGSHFVDDMFSAKLTEALMWPEPPVLGGFDEKHVFPPGNNPKIVGQNKQIPYCRLDTRPGDVIIFNHNLIHCVNAPIRRKTRRLFGLHFAADIRKVSKDPVALSEMDALRGLISAELSQFKLPSFYGKYVLESQSPAIRRQTEFLRDLSYNSATEFDGKHSHNSNEIMELCNRLKHKQPPDARLLN